MRNKKETTTAKRPKNKIKTRNQKKAKKERKRKTERRTETDFPFFFGFFKVSEVPQKKEKKRNEETRTINHSPKYFFVSFNKRKLKNRQSRYDLRNFPLN